jgi:hypothetical protein
MQFFIIIIIIIIIIITGTEVQMYTLPSSQYQFFKHAIRNFYLTMSRLLMQHPEFPTPLTYLSFLCS